MIKALQRYCSEIAPVFIDGMLYVWIAVLTFLSTQIGSDDAEKYLGAQTLFWTKMILGSVSTALVSLKMFRSSSFADHQAEKKKVGETQFISK
jgi:hypothetical protein